MITHESIKNELRIEVIEYHTNFLLAKIRKTNLRIVEKYLDQLLLVQWIVLNAHAVTINNKTKQVFVSS